MLIFCSYNSQGQTQKVRDYLKMVAMGKVADVKKQIPDLLAEYPNDPGVQLLLAVVIDDAFLAVEKYKNIVKTFPESEWADDAYWRIVQFYAVIGDTATAKTELDNYRKKYPASEFLIAATDVVRYSINYAKSDRNPKNAVQSSVSKDMKPLEQEPRPKTETVKKEIPPTDTKSVITTKPKQEPAKKEEPKIADTKPKQETVKKEEIKPKVDVAKKEEIKPAETKPKQEVKKEVTTQQQDNEKYGLQVGVYSSKESADNEVAKFKQQRLISYVINKDIDGTQMYAVVVGEYSSKESAEQARKIVQVQCKCQPIIFKK